MKLKDLLKEALEDNYPPFKTSKAIRVGDKLVTVGRWTFTGKESGGKGVYMNIITKQTLAFDMAELQALSASNPNDIEVLKELVTPSWKPSSNANVEGFVSKSFPLGGKGDALLSKPEFIKKWAPRIQAWIGVEPKLDQVESFFPSQQGMDFKFEGSDGKTYRIYSPGGGARSQQYVVQKMKNI